MICSNCGRFLEKCNKCNHSWCPECSWQTECSKCKKKNTIKTYFFLGYNENLIRSFLSFPNIIYVIEKEKKLTKENLPPEFVDYPLFRCFSKHSIDDLYLYLLEGLQDLVIVDEFEFVYNEPLDDYYNEFINVLVDIFNYIAQRCCLSPLMRNISTMNIIGNLPFLEESEKELNKLEGYFKDKPAIIVGAGPSLVDNLETLKKIQNKLYILAVSRVAKPLLNEGITPDFILNLDWHPTTKKFVENIENIPLIANVNSSVELTYNYKGPKLFDSNLHAFNLIKKNNIVIPKTGTVAGYAIGFAQFCGFNPVILTGVDLSYPDFNENKKHYSLCYDKQDKERIKVICEEGLYRVKNNQGGYNFTDWQMNGYIKEMKWMIKNDKTRTYYNTAINGAYIGINNIKPLKDIPLDCYPVKEKIKVKNIKAKKINYKRIKNKYLKQFQVIDKLLSEVKNNYPVLVKGSKINGLVKRFFKKYYNNTTIISSIANLADNCGIIMTKFSFLHSKLSNIEKTNWLYTILLSLSQARKIVEEVFNHLESKYFSQGEEH